MTRSYRQYCGLARALDVVGDRWNLLIVRQLLLGPARNRELMDGLPGVAPNLLADRLRNLEAAGVIERRPAPVGNFIVYALTPWGAQLRGPIDELIRWSTPLMTSGPGDDPFLPDWLAVAVPALLNPAPIAESATPVVGLDINGQIFDLRITNDGPTIARHDGHTLDATLRADPTIILGLAAGVIGIDDVRDAIEVDGDEGALRTVFARRLETTQT
ncbi:helix-turn-helix domain-containing protein [Gordonia sp. L191]|uniref:winged helix-turn-helix transcriptional regulator n=1 Tax=Gordonia sp. L191 TaxID=2982699 RepID=UPI0024C0B50E|nr:helix-turn-helix domain-containing protein [Gordonia sp. L191]WHU49312.1 helix-turn-helix domain-containing protein [Gordonia sp. L191]